MFKYYYLDNTLYKDKNRNLIKIFLEQKDAYK